VAPQVVGERAIWWQSPLVCIYMILIFSLHFRYTRDKWFFERYYTKKSTAIRRGVIVIWSLTWGHFFQGRQPRLWANHCRSGVNHRLHNNISDEESRKRRCGHASAAVHTVKKHLLSAATADGHGRGGDGVTSYRTRTFGGARVGPSAYTSTRNRASRRLRARQSSRRLVESVVPRPLILQPATDRSDRGRSCVLVRVSRRTSVSVRNSNYIVFRTHAAADNNNNNNNNIAK